ncbi:hypothetical protein GSI_14499 [Ganoderma sinense ZZ0214-1]|uniref:Uncharacterized protein n=1 Tax=Ganoderma sinense ZZ0214-1 TaxID=1077348 RepID=A0A2G8RNV6_9APHY|nr:hypothetical protein GSI_14499 [Ganoderma sinense ZZ0214-1]
MPSPRPAKARARARTRARAAAPARQCHALLADEETCCSSHASGRGRYCITHGQEYGQLTRAYKAASKNVNALEPGIQHAKAHVDALESIAAVDGAIALVDQFLDALGEEIDGREAHHKRFFQVVDENHRKWLKRQRGQEAGAVRLLERLRRRREVVIAVEEAKKRDDDRLRTIEEAHRRAIAGAHRQAIEEARRRATEEARRRAVEDARPRVIVEAQRKAVQQAWSVLGERTNTNQADAEPKSVETVGTAGSVPKPPPKDWPSVVPPPRPYQPPQYPPTAAYYGALQSSREAQPPVLPAKLIRAPIPTRPSSSWPVDIERQGPPAAGSRSLWQTRTEEGTERTTPRDVNLLDYMRTTLFWVATFFVFCYLVVVESLHGCYRLVVG